MKMVLFKWPVLLVAFLPGNGDAYVGMHSAYYQSSMPVSKALIPIDVLLNIVLFGSGSPSRFCPSSRLTVLLGPALNGIIDPRARPPCVEPWTFKSIDFYT